MPLKFTKEEVMNVNKVPRKGHIIVFWELAPYKYQCIWLHPVRAPFDWCSEHERSLLLANVDETCVATEQGELKCRPVHEAWMLWMLGA